MMKIKQIPTYTLMFRHTLFIHCPANPTASSTHFIFADASGYVLRVQQLCVLKATVLCWELSEDGGTPCSNYMAL